MAFALFVDASRRAGSSGQSDSERGQIPQAVKSPEETSAAAPVVPLDLEMLHRELKFIPVFRAGIPGIRLASSVDRIEIIFESDELYAPGSPELQKVWLESLDQIGEVVYLGLEPTLELEIIGFEDAAAPGEPAGRSAGLGVHRAEAILEYFQNHLQEQRSRRVRISGGGRSTRGQRLELRVVRRSL